jgi:hypothetical protein
VTRRHLAAWVLAVPLMIAGTQVAHVFAYRLVYPVARVRLHELVVTGHGYLGLWPLLLGLAGGIELVALISIAAGSFGRRRYTPVPPWAFAVMPLLAYVFQEILERWLAGSSFPWWVVLQPTFRVGLLLQLPFGLLAYLAARLLLRVADDAGTALRRIVGRISTRGASPTWSAFELAPARVPALADGHASRGPPALRPARLS